MLAFDGREVVAEVEAIKLDQSQRRIRENMPVVDSIELLGSRDGRSFVRIATRLPDGPAVREFAAALVERGLVTAASPDVYFMTTTDTTEPRVAEGTAPRVQVLNDLDENDWVQNVLASLPDVPSSVVILGATDSVDHEVDNNALAEQDTDALRQPMITTIATYSVLRTDSQERIFGRSSSQVQSLLTAIGLEPTVVIDRARAMPRSRIVQSLWIFLREAPAGEDRTLSNGVEDEARTDLNMPSLQAK
jgi:hypothetical protein